MRNHLEPPAATVLKLKQHADAALRAETTGELLGIEGGAAAAHFGQFSGMLKLEDELADKSQIPNPKSEIPAQLRFNFTHRNRRPPTDPVNARLSLAYSLLAKDCTLAALAVGFDPYVGFHHQPRFGRPALALDLMEEFRPIVADSVVLFLVNTGTVAGDDFVRSSLGVALKPEGRKRVIRDYERRMEEEITHPVFGYRVSYRRVLEVQCRLLARHLMGEIDTYPEFKTR